MQNSIVIRNRCVGTVLIEASNGRQAIEHRHHRTFNTLPSGRTFWCLSGESGGLVPLGCRADTRLPLTRWSACWPSDRSPLTN